MMMSQPMATEQAVSIRAPAKINLVLRVLDRRPDGYHDLWSLMQTVALEDDIEIRRRGPGTGLQLRCDDPSLPTDRRNLVVRAASTVLERAGLSGDRAPGLEIRVTKRIPVSAGLGGGSSDAAATVMALNTLLELGWSPEDMIKASESLGSDVPFFFAAPCALVRGRGETVEAVTMVGRRWVLLVNPGFPIETKWAYEQLSDSRQGVTPLSDALRRITGGTRLSWDQLVPLMENDFEPAVMPRHGVLKEIKQQLLTSGAETALLSGSGATVFGIFHDEATAVGAKQAFSGRVGWRIYVGATGTSPLTCMSGPVTHPASVG